MHKKAMTRVVICLPEHITTRGWIRFVLEREKHTGNTVTHMIK